MAKAITDKGCRLEYLPPYSPDYNPIEYSFSVIKNALKKRYQATGNEDPEEFAEMVIRAVRVAVTPEIARNQFEHCGYMF